MEILNNYETNFQPKLNIVEPCFNQFSVDFGWIICFFIILCMRINCYNVDLSGLRKWAAVYLHKLLIEWDRCSYFLNESVKTESNRFSFRYSTSSTVFPDLLSSPDNDISCGRWTRLLLFERESERSVKVIYWIVRSPLPTKRKQSLGKQAE